MIDVVLAGVHGYGRNYLPRMRRLVAAGRMRLAGVCDLRPAGPELLDGLGAPAQSADLAGLVAATRAGVVVVATPIHTHVDLAVTALRGGAHVLVEKPPAPSMAEFTRLREAAAATGRTCQVGFQSLGSAAVPAIRRMIAGGRIGRVRGIGMAGAWSRDAAYYARTPWAGHRRLDGVDVVDGALTNPFAHGLATALAIDGGQVEEVELELLRANPIEADDTSCARLRSSTGAVITAAVTLAARHVRDPYLVVHGDRGRITLWYKRDRVEPSGGPTVAYARTDLLDNLLDHAAGRAGPLVPVADLAAFMTVVEAVRTAPSPRAIPSEGGDPRVVPGVDELVAASAARLRLFSELAGGAPWT